MVSFALAASMRHAVFVAEAPDCMREPEGSGGISDEHCRYGEKVAYRCCQACIARTFVH